MVDLAFFFFFKQNVNNVHFLKCNWMCCQQTRQAEERTIQHVACQSTDLVLLPDENPPLNTTEKFSNSDFFKHRFPTNVNSCSK